MGSSNHKEYGKGKCKEPDHDAEEDITIRNKKKKRDAEKDENLPGGWKAPNKKSRIEQQTVDENILMDD